LVLRKFLVHDAKTLRRKNIGHKKNRQTELAVFRETWVLQNDSPLSIRQRLEIPEKVKIKLGGHGGGWSGLGSR